MESVTRIKQALAERSRTASIDDLRTEGRRQVRIVRTEHVVAMIAEAVQAAVENSGMLTQQQVDELLRQTRSEFQEVLKRRSDAANEAEELRSELLQREDALRQLRAEVLSLRQALDQTQQDLDQARSELNAAPATENSFAQDVAPEPDFGEIVEPRTPAPAAPAAPRAQQPAQPQAAPAQPAAAGQPDFSAALEKLAGTLNDRLEQIGRKMGISSAVEADSVNLEGLFRDDGKQVESNIDSVETKQKSGGGIAANLERLKKLKGG
jgi:predicted phage tail protein